MIIICLVVTMERRNDRRNIWGIFVSTIGDSCRVVEAEIKL